MVLAWYDCSPTHRCEGSKDRKHDEHPQQTRHTTRGKERQGERTTTRQSREKHEDWSKRTVDSGLMGPFDFLSTSCFPLLRGLMLHGHRTDTRACTPSSSSPLSSKTHIHMSEIHRDTDALPSPFRQHAHWSIATASKNGVDTVISAPCSCQGDQIETSVASFPNYLADGQITGQTVKVQEQTEN